MQRSSPGSRSSSRRRRRENAVRNAEALVLTYAVNALWMTCAVAAITAVLARGLRRLPAAQQHVLWVVALTLSVLLPMTSLRPATNSVMPPISRSHLTGRTDAPAFFHVANGR